MPNRLARRKATVSDRDTLPSQTNRRGLERPDRKDVQQEGGLLPYFHLETINVSATRETGNVQETRTAACHQFVANGEAGPQRLPDAAELQTRADALQSRMRRMRQEMESRRQRYDARPYRLASTVAVSNSVQQPHIVSQATRHQYPIPSTTRPAIPIYAHTAQNPDWHDAPRRPVSRLAIPEPSHPPRSSTCTAPAQFRRSSKPPPPSRYRRLSSSVVLRGQSRRSSSFAWGAHSMASSNIQRYPSFETALAPISPAMSLQSAAGVRDAMRSSSAGATERWPDPRQAHATFTSLSGAERRACAEIQLRRNGSIVGADYGMITIGYDDQDSSMIATQPEQAMELERVVTQRLPLRTVEHLSPNVASVPRRTTSLPPSQGLKIITSVNDQLPRDLDSSIEYTTDPRGKDSETASDGYEPTIDSAQAGDSAKVASTVHSLPRVSDRHLQNCQCPGCYGMRIRRRYKTTKIWQRLSTLVKACGAFERPRDTSSLARLAATVLEFAEDVARACRTAEYLQWEVVPTSRSAMLFADMPEAQEEERFASLLDTIKRLEKEALILEDEICLNARGTEVGVAQCVAYVRVGPATPLQHVIELPFAPAA